MNNGRRMLLLLAGIFYASLFSYSQKKQPAVPPGIDAYINKVISSLNVPGVGVAIVKDGKVLL
jgi:hypothetical protein